MELGGIYFLSNYKVLQLKLSTMTINISKECLKYHLMLRQMRKSIQCRTMCVSSDTKMIQSSHWLKWPCTLWYHIISRLLSKQALLQMGQQTSSQYFNTGICRQQTTNNPICNSTWTVELTSWHIVSRAWSCVSLPGDCGPAFTEYRT